LTAKVSIARERHLTSVTPTTNGAAVEEPPAKRFTGHAFGEGRRGGHQESTNKQAQVIVILLQRMPGAGGRDLPASGHTELNATGKGEDRGGFGDGGFRRLTRSSPSM
jgi:hypothetical protein